MGDVEANKGESKPKRTSKGQFVKGQSGNPAGRPRSSVNAILAQAREAALGILPKVIEQAENGDVFSQKMLLEMGMPKVKPMPERMNTLQGFPHEATPRIQLMYLLGAMARGAVTTEEAKLYSDTIARMKDLPSVAWEPRNTFQLEMGEPECMTPDELVEKLLELDADEMREILDGASA